MPELDLNVWLKPEDVEPEVELVFEDSGKKTVIPGKDKEPDKPAFEITVIFPNGDTRAWTMNMTSQRAVAATYGTNSDNWVGKKVTLFTAEQNVRGTLRKVIYAKVPKV